MLSPPIASQIAPLHSCFRRCSSSAFPALPKCCRVICVPGKSLSCASGRVGQEANTERAVPSSSPSPSHNSVAGMGGKSHRNCSSGSPGNSGICRHQGNPEGPGMKADTERKCSFGAAIAGTAAGQTPFQKLEHASEGLGIINCFVCGI